MDQEFRQEFETMVPASLSGPPLPGTVYDMQRSLLYIKQILNNSVR